MYNNVIKSSFSTNIEFLDWFKRKYPRNHQLLDDIVDRSSIIFNQNNMPDGKIVQQSFNIVVGNSPSYPSRLTIGVDTYGSIFIG